MIKVESPPRQFESERDASDDISLSDPVAGRKTLGPALTVTGLSKSFLSPDGKTIEVLREVSFTAAAGEVVAITGASGAGKSTLLHLLGGLEAADEGTITLGEFDVTRSSPAALAHFRNSSIGFVFQFHHLLPDLTAAENVAMPLLISRASRAQGTQQAAGILQSLGLRERTNHPIRELSGGEQQRVAVARALVRKPRLVLADEPTGNLDSIRAREIASALLAYARAEAAIVIIATHNLELAGLCDRTMALADGKLTIAASTAPLE